MSAAERVRVGAPRVERRDQAWRVVADVDGQPLWLETADAPLTAAPEAFASIALLPAALAGRSVASDAPLDGMWLANAERLLAVAAEWWDARATPPTAPAGGHSHPSGPGGGTALFFSCGADSFHALLRERPDVGTLVFVDGFDIRLHEAGRAQAAIASVRAVAAARGLRAVVVRTNARDHGLVGAANWERCHGGVLAAVAHALASVAGTFLVSASYPRALERPWGTHWRLDPLWSGSGVALRHTGAERWRADKLRAIAGEPLVRRHLRVCWEHRTPALNCSRCEKCLRTQLVLAECGEHAELPAFDRSLPLAQRIDELRSVSPDLAISFDRLRGRDHAAGVDRAIADLVVRSGGRPRRRPLARLRRAVGGRGRKRAGAPT